MGHQFQPNMEPEYEPEESESGGLPEPRRVGTGDLLGKTLGGRYRFDELLGEGSFARVFRVYDLHRRAFLAAKVLRSDIAHEPAFLERFRREAAVLARLQHPNIVRYYDIVELENTVFILTDYIPGETLQSVLHARRQPLTPLDSLAYITPLASALHFAHEEGIVHRDLKPANILLDENGKLYVTDFGIARILSDASTLTVDQTVGTPHYMSPEQIIAGPLTAATDIYAFGVMLYQLYTGQLPFRGENPEARGTTTAVRIAYEHLHLSPEPPRNVNPRLSEAVEKVILRCLEKDPAQRYASISDVYDALTAAIGTPSVSLDKAEIPEDTGPQAERVPTGVGGLSRVIREDEAEEIEEWPQKLKREPREPRQSHSQARRAARREVRELRDELRDELHDMRDARRQEVRKKKAAVQGEKEREKQSESEEKDQEKEHDKNEKDQEKGTEKSSEKGEFVNEVGPSDRLGQVTWGSILLWAGAVFFLNNFAATSGVFAHVWPWVFGGAGALLLGEVAVRQVIPEYRSRLGSRLIAGVVLLTVGLGMGFGFGSLWPLILIAIGVSLLLSRLGE